MAKQAPRYQPAGQGNPFYLIHYICRGGAVVDPPELAATPTRTRHARFRKESRSGGSDLGTLRGDAEVTAQSNSPMLPARRGLRRKRAT